MHVSDHHQALPNRWRRLPKPHAAPVDVETGFRIGCLHLSQQAIEERPEGTEAGVPLSELLLQASPRDELEEPFGMRCSRCASQQYMSSATAECASAAIARSSSGTANRLRLSK